jgi:hypothetical protein
MKATIIATTSILAHRLSCTLRLPILCPSSTPPCTLAVPTLPSPLLPAEARRRRPSAVATHEPMDKHPSYSMREQHLEWRTGRVNWGKKDSHLKENMFEGNQVVHRRTRESDPDT